MDWDRSDEGELTLSPFGFDAESVVRFMRPRFVEETVLTLWGMALCQYI